MARPLRWVPEGGALVEITCRTIHGRMLLRPSRPVNEVVVGVLARAKRRYPVKICAVAVASNHMHVLAWMPDAERQAEFMWYLNTNLSKEIGRLVGWRQRLWGRRFDPVVVSHEEKAQVARLRYILSHGVKENLVESVLQWPGVHCASALLRGEPLEGFWFDRTKEYAARRRGEDFGHYDYADKETLELDPLPCWAHLDPAEYRRRIASLIEEIEDQAAAERAKKELPVLGVEAVCRQHPFELPLRFEKSPRPMFHAASKAAFEELREAYNWFAAAFYEAVTRLRAGDPEPGFPEGSFPPALAFVPTVAVRPP